MGLMLFTMCAACGAGCLAIDERARTAPASGGMTTPEAVAAVMAALALFALVAIPWTW